METIQPPWESLKSKASISTRPLLNKVSSSQHSRAMSKARPEKRSAKRKYEQPILTMDERHGNIVDFLKKEAKIKVEELADRLRVSQVTIRKDLDALERRGLLQRSHGNAIFSQQSRFNVAFLEKLQIKSPAKESIAQTAASYVQEGDSIVLDSGTTTLSLAKALVGKFKSLFVITNSVPVALELTKAGYDVLLVGGQVRNHSLALLGPMGVKNLESYHVDRAFIGTSGITLAHGFSTPDSLDAQMKQAMIRIADKSYVLSDSSKFGHNCMVSFAKCSEIFRTLTDSGISARTLRQFRQHDVDIRVIPANGGSGR
jgi:DeoR/GlpR family transcriptional regulator of sugar metabolism